MASSERTCRPIWVVSELYYPEETSTGYVLTKIAESVAQRAEVRVLCGQPSYASRGTRAPRTERRNGVQIQRCWATTFHKDFLLGRVVNLLTISFTIALRLWAQLGRGDKVLVVTNPPLLPLLVSVICRWRRADCYLLVHDVYPEVAIAAELVRPDSLLARIASWQTRLLYRRVHRIVTLGRDMQQLVMRKGQLAPDKVVVIPNGADVDSVRPLPRDSNRLLEALGLRDKFVVQYSGNMGRSHGIETVAAAAEQLRNSSDIHFLMIGWGAKRAWLLEQIETRGLTNVTVISPVPRDQLLDSLNACDVSLIPFVAGMSGVSVPCRMYNVMAAGKPILAVADADSELALVVHEEDIGTVVPPEDVDGLCAAIRQMKDDRKRLASLGQRARQVAESKYAWDCVLAAYEPMFVDPPDHAPLLTRAAA